MRQVTGGRPVLDAPAGRSSVDETSGWVPDDTVMSHWERAWRHYCWPLAST